VADRKDHIRAMGLWAYVTEQRKKQVIGIARSHIDGSEEVVCWARAKQPRGKKSGFVYVTPSRLIVYWAGEPEGHAAILWKDIRSWGTDTSSRGGPILGIESDRDSVVVQMPARTNPSAASATEIIRAIAARAPKGADPLDHDHHGILAAPHPHVSVDKERRSIAGHTKRLILTVIGVVMVVGGILITPIPGPWSFPIVLGGLAILATEYDIADDALQWAKERYHRTKQMVKATRARRRSRSR
jgi:uncharacterized protein (TIGR02611 family)